MPLKNIPAQVIFNLSRSVKEHICTVSPPIQEMCVKFWPEEEAKTFGSLTVELTSENEEDDYTTMEFNISNTEVSIKSMKDKGGSMLV